MAALAGRVLPLLQVRGPPMSPAAAVLTVWLLASLAVVAWLWVEARRVPPEPEPSLLDLPLYDAVARLALADFFREWQALVEREAA